MNKVIILALCIFLSCDQEESINPTITVQEIVGSWEMSHFITDETRERREAYFIYSNMDFWAYKFTKLSEDDMPDTGFAYKYEGVVIFNTPEVDTIRSFAYIQLIKNKIHYYDTQGEESPTLPSEEILTVSDDELIFQLRNTTAHLNPITDEQFWEAFGN